MTWDWPKKIQRSLTGKASDANQENGENTEQESTKTKANFEIELDWTRDCIMPTIAYTIFKITSTKLYILIVTLSSKDNVKLTKLLEEGFK